MKIYWGLESIPELKDIPHDKRGKVWRLGYKKSFRHWQVWFGLFLTGLCAAIGSYYFGLIGSAIGGGIGGFIFGQIVVHTARPYIQGILSEGSQI